MLYMSAYLIRVNPNTLNWRQLTEMKSPVNETRMENRTCPSPLDVSKCLRQGFDPMSAAPDFMVTSIRFFQKRNTSLSPTSYV
jgi:hypothetical protein